MSEELELLVNVLAPISLVGVILIIGIWIYGKFARR